MVRVTCTLVTVLLLKCVLLSFADDATFQNVTVKYSVSSVVEPPKSATLIIAKANSLSAVLPKFGDKRIYAVSFQDGDIISRLNNHAVTDLLDLQILDLRDHGIEEIEVGAFKNLPRLMELSLSNNKLREIKSGIFDSLINVTQLNLNYNSLEVITPDAFANMERLDFLRLSHNKLRELNPKWFEGIPHLNIVRLENNLIEEIPDGALENIHSGINLGHNRIKKLSRAIFGSRSVLEGLLIDHNEITTWDENLFENVSLQEFDVSHNRVECLNGNFTKLFSPKVNIISGNPWTCNCFVKLKELYSAESKNKLRLNPLPENCN